MSQPISSSTHRPSLQVAATSSSVSNEIHSQDQEDRQIVFRDGEIDGVVISRVQRFTDQRGWLSEVYREDELPANLHPVMAYVSETLPGVARGPHEHVHQTDYFLFLGPGDFEIYLWDARPDSPTRGNKIQRIGGKSNPCVVLVPPGVVHAYKNVSDHPGWVFNAPNRLYAGHGKQEPVDEIRHEDAEQLTVPD